ncbi:MAG TPA: lamin tail domain-containing protein, partial [Clostridia bacterium]|nr:lamin tail domain-containing protein [Clostridia bacterium]
MIPRVLVFFSSAWLAVSAGAAVLVPQNSVWRFEKGWAEASIPDIGAWRQLGFTDAGWALGQAPFYYENQPGSANASTGNTKLTDMFGNYTCVFLRRTFVVDNPWDIAALQVAGHSDDGFIAWINGQEVGRFNMPDGEIQYSATSRGALPEPVPWWTNIVEDAQAFLMPGTNVFAIQAFNSGKGNSSDFSISPALYFTLQTGAPTVSLVYPQPGSAVRGLVAVEVAFTRPVMGVEETDLLINGQPAQGLITVTPSQYVFTFAEPAAGLVHVGWASGHGIRDLSTAGNAFVGGTWSYNLDPSAPVQGVLITEFMADNSGDQPNSVKDEFGASPDWIELHNHSSQPVNLTGWCLSDNASRLNKWRFPEMLIPANGYLVVLASDRNTNVAGALHTNFKLSSDPGYLALSDPALNVVSAFAPSYPEQFTDISYGRDLVETDVTGYY